MNGCPRDAGDRRVMGALDALFRAEEPKLRRFFRRRARAGEDAHDLVQEAFVRFAGIASTTVPDRPAAYLQRIATNLLIDLSRSRPPPSEPIQSDIPVRAEQEDAITVADMMEIYRSTLAAMPERTRRVFELHRLDELPYREIGMQLGISIPAVQQHVATALERIAIALQVED